MDRVSAEFHRNVLLLNNFIPPNDDFKKCFREGMFDDKPNSPGFIQVSYYLLGIYYKNQLKNKIKWPIICKETDERVFRKDVVECIQNISKEHPYMNFPPILASLFITPKGTKFLLIMWKLSLLILTKHLKECYEEVLSMPKPGSCINITKIFLTNLAKSNNKVVLDKRLKREKLEKELEVFLEKKNQKQSKLKSEILEKKEELKEIAKKAKANDIAKKRLLDVEDNEIINILKQNITNDIDLIENKSSQIKDISNFAKNLSGIVLNITGNTKSLNGSEFKKVKIEQICSGLSPEQQIIACELYIEDNLHLHNFFEIFKILLLKYKASCNKNKYNDFIKFYSQIKTTNKDLQILLNHYQELIDGATEFSEKQIKRYNVPTDIHNTILPFNSELVFMPSPPVQLKRNDELLNDNQNQLILTPKEGIHKSLFSKYKNNKKFNLPMRKPLPVQHINFDEISFNQSNEKLSSTKIQSPLKKSCVKNSNNKYSRLFSTRKPSNSKVNNSMMNIMSTTEFLPLIKDNQSKIFTESCISNHDITEDPILLKRNMNSTTVESEKNDDENFQEKNKSRRRSISDLVERYKKIIEKSNTNTSLDIIKNNNEISDE